MPPKVSGKATQNAKSATGHVLMLSARKAKLFHHFMLYPFEVKKNVNTSKQWANKSPAGPAVSVEVSVSLKMWYLADSLQLKFWHLFLMPSL